MVDKVLIIGAGQCGAMAAINLRENGFKGSISLVGAETHLPYERPPLSKSALLEPNDDFSFLRKEEHYAEQNIALHLGRSVVALDTVDRIATLDDGMKIAWDRCLLTTGGSPRIIERFPFGSRNIHYLRTLDDARRLRDHLERCSGRLLIVGAGFLGLEVASTARELGIAVTVLETGEQLLRRALPQATSEWLADRIRRQGVDLRFATTIVEGGHGKTLALSDGTMLETDQILVAAGMTPNTQLARDAGLNISPDGGIAVDANCQTSVEGVYAAGDCATQLVPHTGVSMRLESWQYANEQARMAANAIVGHAQPATPTPWFWSDQFNCNIQMLGMPVEGLTYVQRNFSEDAEKPKWISFGLRNKKLHHVICVNAGGEIRALRNMMQNAIDCDAEALVNATLPLRSLEKQFAASSSAAQK